MKMLNRSQIVSLGAFILLLVIIMGMRTKPQDLISREKERSLNLQSTDINTLRQEASSVISDSDKARIQILESRLNDATDDQREEILKELSSAWYGASQPGIAGYYAEEVAVASEDAAAWGIAGTTYALCVKRSEKEKERSLCLAKALEAMENAISLDPDELSYQINRAVILAENPPRENPMQGVQLLLGLNKNFPENVSVINNIAKFALQTNQLDKAEQRLLGAIDLEPDNVTTNCLLAQLYYAKGENDKASNFESKCNK